MSKTDFILKRIFDVSFSSVGIIIFSPVIILCWIVAAIETRSNGFFVHKRAGRYGNIIHVYKIKTMHPSAAVLSSIASNNVAFITKSGTLFRKYKLDELPQLFNVLGGSMSFVGPRPDVPYYAEHLEGSDRTILLMRPGITGPASIKYKNEEALLSAVDDPVFYNDTVIWPDKVRINKEYFANYSMLADIKYIVQTFFK
jgi:lipopolysaccharide/colanic/teichoic acid biosynthesis glycosyltransferase